MPEIPCCAASVASLGRTTHHSKLESEGYPRLLHHSPTTLHPTVGVDKFAEKNQTLRTIEILLDQKVHLEESLFLVRSNILACLVLVPAVQTCAVFLQCLLRSPVCRLPPPLFTYPVTSRSCARADAILHSVPLFSPNHHSRTLSAVLRVSSQHALWFHLPATSAKHIR